MEVYIALVIFFVAFTAIAFETFDKSLIALGGALLMIFFGILTPEEAIASIEYETILLLLGMMVLVNIASKSGIFEWLNVKIVALTKGSPILIFIFFSLLTATISAFLDNVTTILIIVPLTIELIRGMGKDPKPYVFAEVILSNIGGALTLIGDPPNIIIGGAADLSFNQFIINLWMPIAAITVTILGVLIALNWKNLKPISRDIIDLFTVNFLIRKIKQKFVKRTLHKDFIIKVLIILGLTIFGFFFHEILQIPGYLVAFAAAVILAILTSRRVSIHESFKSVEWTTIFFFAGLFVMVGGIENIGVLDLISNWITNSTDNLLYLALIILWASGIVSGILDNIPFVTVMIPVIIGIQANLGPGVSDPNVLWWALSLGACLGGNSTMIGASANVIGMDLLKKNNYNISFVDFMKFGIPLTFIMLSISSIYLILRIGI